MGRFKDAINKRKGKQVEQPQEVKQTPPEEIHMYNRVWLERIANEGGYAINEEGGKVDGILKALNRREGHCPCGGNGKQFLCPCHIMRNNGICKCGLFRNAVDINPKDATSTVVGVRRG